MAIVIRIHRQPLPDPSPLTPTGDAAGQSTVLGGSMVFLADGARRGGGHRLWLRSLCPAGGGGSCGSRPGIEPANLPIMSCAILAVDLGLLGSGLRRAAAARGPAGALIGCGSGDVTTTVAQSDTAVEWGWCGYGLPHHGTIVAVRVYHTGSGVHARKMLEVVDDVRLSALSDSL